MTAVTATLVLPALRGDIPVGFLAALGLLRALVEERRVHQTRLSWTTDGCAVLHGTWTTPQEVAGELAAVVDGIPDGGVLPGCPPDFPPPGRAGGDPARPAPECLPEVYGGLLADPVVGRWIRGILLTDGTTQTPNGKTPYSPFMAPVGRQSVRSFFEKPLAAVRDRPTALLEALTGWIPVAGVTGEQLDHSAYAEWDNSGDTRPHGVPGVTWLATMALPLLPVTDDQGWARTPMWYRHDSEPHGQIMVWPLWSPPLDIHAVGCLLVHPYLTPQRPLNPALQTIGVTRLCAGGRDRPYPEYRGRGLLCPTPNPWSN